MTDIRPPMMLSEATAAVRLGLEAPSDEARTQKLARIRRTHDLEHVRIGSEVYYTEAQLESLIEHLTCPKHSNLADFGLEDRTPPASITPPGKMLAVEPGDVVFEPATLKKPA